jgi:hypothetical protein
VAQHRTAFGRSHRIFVPPGLCLSRKQLI